MRILPIIAVPASLTRSAKALACVAAGLLAMFGPDSGARARGAHPSARTVPPPIEVASLGGALQDAQQAAFFGPFAAAAKRRVRVSRWDGTLAALQGDGHGAAPIGGSDLALMDDSSALAACSKGLLLPIDPSAIPALGVGNGPLDVDSVSPCGIGAFRSDLVLAWDKSRIDTPPNWSMFWDVARRPGKRGLARDPRGTLEIALLADGVSPDALYRTLGTDAGLDRAFRKLDQLKPYVVWWRNPAEAVRIIETGAVLMTSAPNGEIAIANREGHRDFGIQWENSLSTMVDWVLPGHPPANPTTTRLTEGERDAYALINFTLEPARQLQFVSRYPAQSLLRKDPAAAESLPVDSANTAEHREDAIHVDAAFWAEHLPAIQARFDRWLAGTTPNRP
ncbi:extracellular solute-binding protein [Acetobacteraceae bacterium KSS8]|uniref:Extracellular solute-binding protein n=1 Tax=Endosaccharibacter trunci TaxID=2812733 RepID=A0ABT1WCF4_9PROT|nr:extracellular solute-binding protein [Acetobacteraceae bacterium KSS8]